MPMNPTFGGELRRLREQAGRTLHDLARETNYSRSHLSRIERGEKRPSVALARRCDALFRAAGRLQELAEEEPPDLTEALPLPDRPLGRRGLLTAGAASLIGYNFPSGAGSARPADISLADPFRVQLEQMRRLGQSADPGTLLDLLGAQTRTVARLAVAQSSSDGAELLVLAAHFANYTGWMAQESGDNRAALDWTAKAVDLAEAGGDRDLSSYALVRQALVAFYDHDAAQTVALAGRAQSERLPSRIRGLAAQREAQGHALAGDERACLLSLDRARALFAAAPARTGADPVIGTSHLTDPAAMVTGWCLFDLGRPREAAEVFDRECLRIPDHALRSRTRYGLRRARAHAAAGEVERACEIASELLDLTVTARSATVTTDVRNLARELARFRTLRAVRELQPALSRALALTRP
ncbi:helix-turn-helix transcriptional regulator [Streptomyces catenulae]|uniref:Helix-turn-helix transcriptional regulator n=1 Tax=Streptomyces catenulae TaxID=66875 RepID=A0ABV2Z6Q9_9ACTN|nr:helix-turn-helix transcriptional regulator [Streptomyces catenulae]